MYCPPGPAAELFREAGAVVHTGAVAGFTHIWASTYRGRRWLLFGRELARLPSHARQFRRTLRAQRFGLVHFNDSPLIPAAYLARREGLPVVWHLRSALPEQGRDRRSALIRRAIRKFATTSIAINRDVSEVFDVGSTVVPNSVDLQRFRPGDRDAARAALDLPSDLPVVSFFGFIYPSKGFHEFIEAAARLRERGVDASYLVVGGAVRGQEFFRTVMGRSLQLVDLTRDYESEAKDLVHELGLDDVVRFIPFTQDTTNLYQASDVVVAPSQGPELGRPVIEAAASGVPVVASGSRTGGGVVVPGETGVLVPDYGVESIAEAVAELLQDADRRHSLGRTARAHAEENFDPARNARRIESVYHAVLPTRDRIPILYVHHRPQLGGAPSSLAQLIRHLTRVPADVFCLEGPAADCSLTPAIVHMGTFDLRARVGLAVRGLRWLVLCRELASLQSHVRQLDTLMRQHRFPIVHLNDSPRPRCGLVARSHGAEIVWHLRSALAGEGRDRRSS